MYLKRARGQGIKSVQIANGVAAVLTDRVFSRQPKMRNLADNLSKMSDKICCG